MPKKANNWHFARPKLAKTYLDLFEVGLTSARGLFARRRMGKTEFLKQDFIPAAEARGYVAVYVNLWDLELDPATALVSEFYKAVEPKGFDRVWAHFKRPIKKVKASGKVPGIGEGTVEAELADDNRLSGTLLMEAVRAFDKTKIKMILVIDEAQVLAYDDNAHFAHALRAALDIRKDRIKVIFAGSSEPTLRRMFGVSSEPFYNWAPLEPFELLGRDFVEAMVERVNTISKYELSVVDALHAFSQLKNTPEFFRRYVEHYVSNPLDGSAAALAATKTRVFSDEGFKQQWDALLAADKVILAMLAGGVTDLHSKAALSRLGSELGIGDAVNKNTIQNALRRLSDKNIVTKIDYGLYQFEDEALADWVRHRDA
ncbi:hypothetical protein [Paraherbaspirillum soli]|uniref:ATPase domain-containing protein n=1 Tax=Paraherbaspirillum soli TaxID=631222 RepID=A0ABW0MC05_9BURK